MRLTTTFSPASKGSHQVRSLLRRRLASKPTAGHQGAECRTSLSSNVRTSNDRNGLKHRGLLSLGHVCRRVALILVQPLSIQQSSLLVPGTEALVAVLVAVCIIVYQNRPRGWCNDALTQVRIFQAFRQSRYCTPGRRCKHRLLLLPTGKTVRGSRSGCICKQVHTKGNNCRCISWSATQS